MNDETLARYEILGKLGEGGMGVLYRARDTRLGRTVAIKVLRAEAVTDPGRKRRFVQEAKAASALNHPTIVTVYDIGEDPDKGTFIAMEYLDGESLRERLARGPLAVPEAVRIATEMARGLAAAHASGIVHRDVKPANVMITGSGAVKVLDFGLAKLFQSEGSPDDSRALTVTAAALTAQGIVMGTPAYMSPEQAEGRRVDARSDVFSLGAVLYEMLAGRRPFAGANEISLLSSILRDPPPPLHGLRPEVGPQLEALVARCLEKDPRARYDGAKDLVSALEACLGRTPTVERGAPNRLLVKALGGLLVALALGGAGFSFWKSARERAARRDLLPEIARLSDADEIVAAFALIEKARPFLAGDPQFEKLRADIVMPGTFHSEPEGALVEMKPYAEPNGPWQSLGRTPLEKLELPRAYFRFQITKAGYAPRELAFGPHRVPLVRLVPESETPTGMVLVPAGRVEYQRTPAADLPEFWLDRSEVTNRQFKEFVDAGGYRRRELWKHSFTSRGKPLPFDEAMARLRDETGRPGPAGWQLGSYREGQADLPVSGVSWYEAAAYAEFVHKSLPTFQQWFRAADLNLNSAEILRFSNFGGEGPRAVGAGSALSAFGNYDLAGNVREWVWSGSGGRRYTLGGAWSDPSYLFTGPDALDPMDRSPILGLRCARNDTPLPPSTLGPIEEVLRDPSKIRPVSDAVFSAYKAAFADDPGDLGLKQEGVDDRLDYWRVEKVSYAAAYGGERITARLFLPKNARPPFQAVVYFPPASALFIPSSEGLGSREFGFLVRSGRAVLFPVYQGTYERRRPEPARGGPGFLRDLLIQRARDVRRSIDFLEARPDIDPGRIAFYGLSMGADMGTLVGAVEDRFRVLVLVAGGLPDGLPDEVDFVHFAPRMRKPVLMINGRYDFYEPLETSQRPLFRLLGTPAADKRHVLFESGHVAPWPGVVKETLDWLDHYLGPVPPLEVSRP